MSVHVEYAEAKGTVAICGPEDEVLAGLSVDEVSEDLVLALDALDSVFVLTGTVSELQALAADIVNAINERAYA
jgi:hypothetical protein